MHLMSGSNSILSLFIIIHNQVQTLYYHSYKVYILRFLRINHILLTQLFPCSHSDEIQFEQLTEKLTAKQTELKLCVFLVEHCLYLLWAHLDYYMLHAVPAQTSYCHQFAGNGGQLMGSDAAWKVTTDHVAQLKKSLNQVLNETFSKQLLATAAQNETADVDRDFVAALLRRVKRLIQFAPGMQ